MRSFVLMPARSANGGNARANSAVRLGESTSSWFASGTGDSFRVAARGRLVSVARLWISDARQALRLMVDLQRRVIDLEAFGEQAFELAPDRVAVVAGSDKDMRRERREARCDRPHVQVVHVGHAGILGEGVADFGHAHPFRCCLEEHAPRIAQEAVLAAPNLSPAWCAGLLVFRVNQNIVSASESL